ncbi:DMT family transporter [Micromonospora sp. CPCC 206061]|uniref:DMT family transporter n=1 Tax=Micromonospora sp. CPCC 206061 TaxID=3122410 RepID=UPI002FEEC8B7
MHHRPDPLTFAALTIAVVSISSSAPMIAYAAAPALALAVWRNLLAAGVLAPVAVVRRGPELRALVRGDRRREGGYSLLAGAALAVHFGAWMPSAKLTSVATATALVCTQPVWQGLIATRQGKRLPRTTWVGIGMAVAGAALATGADIAVSGKAILGDLLALVGAVAAAVYTALGERARTGLSTTTYTLVCYTMCAVGLLAVCLIGQVRLVGFDSATWLVVLGLVIGPQLLGHSMLNYALHRISATTVSILVLLEVPGSALIAWAWLDQIPPLPSLPGLSLLVAGVAVVVLGGARTRALPPPQ